MDLNIFIYIYNKYSHHKYYFFLINIIIQHIEYDILQFNLCFDFWFRKLKAFIDLFDQFSIFRISNTTKIKSTNSLLHLHLLIDPPKTSEKFPKSPPKKTTKRSPRRTRKNGRRFISEEDDEEGNFSVMTFNGLHRRYVIRIWKIAWKLYTALVI